MSAPVSILLIVPMTLLAALVGIRAAGQDVNILTQIGFLVLVGLAAKNAILIVESRANWSKAEPRLLRLLLRRPAFVCGPS